MKHLFAFVTVFAISIFGSSHAEPLSPVAFVELPRISSPSLSYDGQYLLYLRSEVDWEHDKEVDRYRLLNLRTGTEQEVPQPEEPDDDFDEIVWHPFENRFLMLAERGDDEHDQAYIYDVESHTLSRLTDHPGDVSDIVWSTSGDGFFFSSERRPEPVDEHLLEEDWLIEEYETKQPNEIWYFGLQSGESRPVVVGNFSVRNFSLSRKGDEILYSRASHGLPDRPDSELWVHDLNSDENSRLTYNQYAEGHSKLSPSGQSIAYIASVNHDGAQYYEDNLFVQRRGDSAATLLMRDIAMEVLDFAWGNSETDIYVLGNTGLRTHVYQLDLESEILQAITTGDASIDDWSYQPDVAQHTFIKQTALNPGEVFVYENGTSTAKQVTSEYADFERDTDLPDQTAYSWTAADGTPLEGLLVMRNRQPQAEAMPLVTITHGGPRSSSQFGSWNLSRYVTVLAGEGYAVFLPNHRGSAGYGDDVLRDMVGGYFRNAHLDVLSGIDALVEEGIADPDKLIKMGWSAGGHMTNKLITVTDRFRAASSGAGASDWVSMYAESDVRHNRTPWFGGAPWQENAPIDSYTSQSILKDAWKVKTPVLFLVGANDKRVPPTQSIMMYRGVKATGTETRLYIAPKQPHNYRTPKYRLFKINTELEWYARHLGRAPYTRKLPSIATVEAPNPLTTP